MSKKKKSKKTSRESSADSSSDASGNLKSHRRMNFGRSVTQSLKEVANVDSSRRKTVRASSTVRRFSFLPHVPAIVGESPRQRAARTAKLVKASDCKEKFGKKGDAELEFRECADPKKCIPGILSFFANNHVRIGAASTDSQSLAILNEVSNELHQNANVVSQYMELNSLPLVSRNFMNEVLHDMKCTVENEGSIPDRHFVDHFVHYMLKTGRIPSVTENGAGGMTLGQGRQNRRNVGSSNDRFTFDPSKHPAQKRPSKDAQICYDCANALFKAGKLKEGENPPEKCWFASYNLLMKHKAEKKCGQ